MMFVSCVTCDDTHVKVESNKVKARYLKQDNEKQMKQIRREASGHVPGQDDLYMCAV